MPPACATGDALLSRETETTFMAGAFAAGHLAYIALFLTHPASDPALKLTPCMVWPIYRGAQAGLLIACT